jgi:hypothetical protein
VLLAAELRAAAPHVSAPAAKKTADDLVPVEAAV